MRFALTTAHGINQAVSKQLEKAATDILYDFRNTPVHIAAAALSEKMNEYCGYWMPWLGVTVDRITVEDVIHLTVKKK